MILHSLSPSANAFYSLKAAYLLANSIFFN